MISSKIAATVLVVLMAMSSSLAHPRSRYLVYRNAADPALAQTHVDVLSSGRRHGYSLATASPVSRAQYVVSSPPSNQVLTVRSVPTLGLRSVPTLGLRSPAVRYFNPGYRFVSRSPALRSVTRRYVTSGVPTLVGRTVVPNTLVRRVVVPNVVQQVVEQISADPLDQTYAAAVDVTENEERKYPEETQEPLPPPVPVIEDEPTFNDDSNNNNNNNEASAHDFSYSVSDGLGNGHAREEQGDGRGVVQGSYSISHADGTSRIVQYRASPLTGFTANVVTNEHGTDAAQQPADVSFDSIAQPPPPPPAEPVVFADVAPVKTAVTYAQAAPVLRAPEVGVLRRYNYHEGY